MIDLNKNFLIYGYGISGKSIEKFLSKKKCKYNVYDDFVELSSNDKSINELQLKRKINKFDYIVTSPSIKITKKHLLYSHKKKIIIDLDFLSLSLSNQIVIGITGTEGKSTTCQYLYQVISKKYKTAIIGNFGNTILDKSNYEKLINNLKVLIIELSSYQLDKIKFLKLDYAAITNIYSDHLNYHGNNRNYINTKIKIYKLLKNNAQFFINSKDYKNHYMLLKNLDKKSIVKVIYHKKKLSNFPNILNNQNIEMVQKIINKFDKSLVIDRSKLSNLPFRCQLIYKSKKLSIYNDSKCTNLKNAIMKNNLIQSHHKILILGGIPKTNNESFSVKDTLVLIFGPFSSQFLNKILLSNSKYFIFDKLTSLITFMKLICRYYKYDTILFSPGGESYDLYDDYKHRGKEFTSLIKKNKF